jgi:ribonuclease-3
MTARKNSSSSKQSGMAAASSADRSHDIEAKIGIVFSNKSILLQAFTHRSYLNEHRGERIDHNERLEFLGDAVLELVVTAFLYKKFPTKAEGDLTAYRSALVNTNSLAKVAEHLGLNQFLRLSKGEARDTGRARSIILANTIEALIGSIYLDQGYDAAAGFITKYVFEVIDIDDIIANKLWLDAKSRFQERAQEVFGITPAYRVLKEVGPDHSKQFTLGVFLGDVQVATGAGPSKQEAEQKAAEKALQVKGW